MGRHATREPSRTSAGRRTVQLFVRAMLVASCLLVACQPQTTTVTQAPAPAPTQNRRSRPEPPAPTPAAASRRQRSRRPPLALRSFRLQSAPASPVAASPVAASPVTAASPVACRYGQTRRVANLLDTTIKEASALVASKQWPGIYWTLNDSGNDPLIFAFDEQGRSRGTFRVDDADNVDWESMQLGPGRDGGFALYIGDTGDNDGVRRDSTIYRIPEPQPEPPQSNNRPRPKSTAPAEAFKFSFPGDSRDVEAMIVHPTHRPDRGDHEGGHRGQPALPPPDAARQPPDGEARTGRADRRHDRHRAGRPSSSPTRRSPPDARASRCAHMPACSNSTSQSLRRPK